MSKLTVVAHIHAKPAHVAAVKAELLKLIDTTRVEEGCLQYDLHQDDGDPAHFMYFENWASRDLWQVHMGTQPLADYMAATEGKVDEFRVYEMTHIA